MLHQKTKKNLLIVDDDDILLAYLQKCLFRNGYIVSCLSDGEGIPSILEKDRFDLVVLDVNLPGKNGFYWLNWLRHYHPTVQVIMASVNTGEDDRLCGLENGALDYLIKPFHDQELLIRIGNIFHHHPSRSIDRTIHIGELTLDTINNRVLKEGIETRLTLLEVNILKLLYLNAGATLSRDDIMQHVRGTKHNPLDRSIDIHINKIRKKIEEDSSNPSYIHTIRGKGYCLQLPDLNAELE